jgi:SAM-dependent methyltransferase
MTLAEGDVCGEWDLRGNTQHYLGDVELKGRSVLEIGPASGYLSFYMEDQGAHVTCLEPSMAHLWDIVPFEGFDTVRWRQEFTNSIEMVRNSFWYVHQQKKSRVRMVEGDPYALPEALGVFDVSLLACVLLHCRSPFDILRNVAAHTRRTVIVTEQHNPALGNDALCGLLPHRHATPQVHTWWQFTPQFFISILGLLGFTEVKLSFHVQKQPATNSDIPMFTVVCERPMATRS